MSGDAAAALAAAVQALPVDKAKARKVFVIATEDDPEMADGWLGRVAAGDRSLATLARLADLSMGIGLELRQLGVLPHQLGATFALEWVGFPIEDEQSARLAYAAALLDERRFDDTEAVLDALAPTPWTKFVRAALGSRTRRWPDVLAATNDCARWPNAILSAAASLMEAWAAGSLGLGERGLAAAKLAETSPTPEVVRDAMFCRALVTRAMGDEEQARALLTDIAVRWPDFDRARAALSDATFALEVTDPATIDSRTDRWDPATATTRAQRQAAETAGTAKQRLADAESTLTAMVGMDAVKKKITA
ncbi:MAG: type VII secretion AAA-ATPase EccA, partial [Mycolicibacterium sp.]|nr:type VII secretion AAA-ATPase EccA [Mycolicibacterium sp.]